MKKRICLILVVLMLVGILGGCQSIEEFKGGLAVITGTKTEPPSPFTPPPEKEDEPEVAPEPTSRIIQMQEIPKEDSECETCRNNGVRPPNDDETTLRIAQELHDTYRPSIPMEHIHTRYAYEPTEDDYTDRVPTYISTFYELPLNVYCNSFDKFETPKEVYEDIGEDRAMALASSAAYYAMAVNAFTPEGVEYYWLEDEDPGNYFTAAFIQEQTRLHAEHSAKYKMKQNSYTLVDSWCVYKDGDGRYVVRVHLHICTRTADKAAREAYGITENDIGRWYQCINDYALTLDETGKVSSIEERVLTDMFEVTDKEYIAYLESTCVKE